MLRLLADENFNGYIVRGLLLDEGSSQEEWNNLVVYLPL